MRPPIGIPGNDPEFAMQVNVSNPTRKLRFDLPGGVYRVGPRSYLLSLIPVARIVLAGTSPLEFAVARFAERNRQKTTDAMAPLAGKKGRITSFAIRVESDVTYREAVDAASSQKTLPVEMRIELQVAGKSKAMRSDVFPARMTLRKEPGPSGNADDTDEGWHLFGCHAHWYSMAFGFGRYTLCHGSTCPAGQTCRCNGTGACKGWCWCVCK